MLSALNSRPPTGAHRSRGVRRSGDVNSSPRVPTARCLTRFALLVALALMSGRVAWAQEVGTIAALEGRVEIGRAGVWAAATVATTINLTDEIRTGRPGRLRLVFRDDCVLTVGDSSHVIINEQIFDPSRGVFRTLIELLEGTVRGLVSEYYGLPSALYLLRTRTAVTGVRGTEFIVIYDRATEVTEVVGVSGRTEVHSVIDLVGRGVYVTARELTRVARGQFPTRPVRLDDAVFQQYLEGLAFIGGGQAESLTAGQPLLTGEAVAPGEQAAALPDRTVGDGPVPMTEPRICRECSVIQQPPAVIGSDELIVDF